MSQSDNRRFSIIQLMVLLIALGLVAALFSAGASHRNRQAAIETCRYNLRVIGTAAWIYAQEGDEFPALTSSARAGEMVLFRHRASRPATDGVPSPTADLWMLVASNMTTPRLFNCPATSDLPDPAQDTTVYYDFTAPVRLSYAYIYQYHPDRPPVGFLSNPMMPVIADANPFIKGGAAAAPSDDHSAPAQGNSRNHRPRWGQNVMFQDSHVQFVQSPKAGLPTDPAEPRERDHIYTTTQPAGGGGVRETIPTATRVINGGADDACLVP